MDYKDKIGSLDKILSACDELEAFSKSIDTAAIDERVKKMTEEIEKSAILEMTSAIGKPEGSDAKSGADADAQAEDNGQDKAQEQKEEKEEEPEKTLEELLDELNSLVGLEGVKKEVEQIINLIKVRKKGEEFGEKQPDMSLHLVFYGNPGTGKTTVARLLAKIYKQLGVLSKGQLVEVDRSQLVAGYVGQTATKTQNVINSAMGGILFIDEAYTLTYEKGASDYGQEAVDTILKAMEDHRDDFIVIVAGYPERMESFINSNPGLKSRFNQYINFEDYTPDELEGIFRLQCDKQKLVLADDTDATIKKYFEEMYADRGEDYANGRDVRNYFEKVLKARANRLAGVLDTVTHEEFMMITNEDLLKAQEDNDKL